MQDTVVSNLAGVSVPQGSFYVSLVTPSPFLNKLFQTLIPALKLFIENYLPSRNLTTASLWKLMLFCVKFLQLSSLSVTFFNLYFYSFSTPLRFQRRKMFLFCLPFRGDYILFFFIAKSRPRIVCPPLEHSFL